MSRNLKRVPLDFDWPLNQIWPGYYFSLCGAMEDYNKKTKSDQLCEKCKKFARIAGFKFSKSGCPELPFTEPPKGDGYQLWEDCSEGSPISPVFKTLKELCAYCEDNCTTFASSKTTKENWFKMLSDDNVYHQEGNMVFI